jgi:predicted phage-related endonuclease
MEGKPEDLLKLWKLKRGEAEPEDLSHILPVCMGVVTEELNRHWFEQVTGFALGFEGDAQTSEEYPWMKCTLDGWVEALACPFEAKHMNAFADMDQAVRTYMPQLQHQMIVTESDKAVLSVFFGTLKHDWVVVPRDEAYCKKLIDRETLFWHCVESGEALPEWQPLPAPALPSQFRTVDMTHDNWWAANAGIYVATEQHWREHENAKKDLKAKLDPDVGTAHGHGIVAKRSKSGAITIRKGEV